MDTTIISAQIIVNLSRYYVQTDTRLAAPLLKMVHFDFCTRSTDWFTLTDV